MCERCAAHLRNGDQCSSVAVKGSLCAHHRDVVGKEALRTGRHAQRRRQDSTLVRAVTEPTPTNRTRSVTIANGTDANGVVTPSDVRPRLAAAAAANLSELERVLLDAATGVSKPTWVTIGCKHCGKQARYEITTDDWRVRLDAVEKLLQQGLGRAREAQEAPVSEVPAVAADVTKLGWHDLQRFAATFCLDELEAVHRRGGEPLLRERVAKLSSGARRVLREALAEAR